LSMDTNTEMTEALRRSSLAHAAYAEMLGGRLSSGVDAPLSDRERMKKLQAEIEAADAEVARVRQERAEPLR
jgi:hypothetical protein